MHVDYAGVMLKHFSFSKPWSGCKQNDKVPDSNKVKVSIRMVQFQFKCSFTDRVV